MIGSGGRTSVRQEHGGQVRTLLRYLGGVALVGLLVVAGTWVRVAQIADRDERAAADAIVVLGAAQYDGDPSPVFRARLDHAAQLYRDGVAPRIVTIGGGRPDDVTTEGQAGAVYLTGAGIDPAALVPVGAGADTLASLRAADGVLAARGWTSVVLVTDPPHAARSALMARDLGWSVQTSPVREDRPSATTCAPPTCCGDARHPLLPGRRRTVRHQRAGDSEMQALTGDYDRQDLARLLTEPPKTAALPGTADAAGRSPFARDRARVLHSKSFRRLAGKTQVVALMTRGCRGPGSPIPWRSRRSPARWAPNWGATRTWSTWPGWRTTSGTRRSGTTASLRWTGWARRPAGSRRTRRTCGCCAGSSPRSSRRTADRAGCNLTRSSLDAVIKYPWPRPVGGGKFGVYADEQRVFDWVRAPAAGRRRCLEAQVMDWADDVAYSVHDVEDGVASGRIDLTRLADPDERDAVCAAAHPYTDESVADLRTVLDDLLALPAVVGSLGHPPGRPRTPR